MAGVLQIHGTDKMELLGKELRAIGGPGARGIRSNLRRGILVEAKPAKTAVQTAYRAIPNKGKSTGLGNELASATKIKVLASSRRALVRIFVDPKAMKKHPASLIAYMEGVGRAWSHPVYARGDDRSEWTWRPQNPVPTFYRTLKPRVAAVRTAAVLAVRRTLAQLPKEM